MLQLLAACAGAPMSQTGDDRLIVPEALRVTALPGGNGVLSLRALSLQEGRDGLELYAALRNDGDTLACHAALAVELFDEAEQSLAAGIGGLLSQHFYALDDDAHTIAACIGPGELTLAALLELDPGVALADVAHIVYRCPYFALSAERIAGGLEVTQLERAPDTGFRGTLENRLSYAIEDPSLSVFPLARSGRPLGMATARGALTLAPGERWDFETSAIEGPAADQLAFPAGTLRR